MAVQPSAVDTIEHGEPFDGLRDIRRQPIGAPAPAAVAGAAEALRTPSSGRMMAI
jgi:hypothetical protein